MKLIGCIITDDCISVVIDGQPYVVSRENAQAHQIIEAIRNGESADEIKEMFDLASAIEQYMTIEGNGTVEVAGEQVLYKGEPLHNVVSEKIIAFMREDLPVEPLIRLLENLMQNPSKRSVDQLYKFLEVGQLPITNDGCFLAYKAVCNDWLDKHSRKFSNHIGAVIECDRNTVDDNPNADCSYGYHAGNLKYVIGDPNTGTGGFAQGDDKRILVKINPRDVVSVPHSDCGKLRCCRYEVVAEYKQPLNKVHDNRFAPALPVQIVNTAPAYRKLSGTAAKPRKLRVHGKRKSDKNHKRQQRDRYGHFC